MPASTLEKNWEGEMASKVVFVLTISEMVNAGKTSLKGQCHEIFCFWFFHESVSPKTLSIPLGPFRIFSKIRGDIRSSRLTTGINDTGGKFCHQFH
jgi:hypothetical protein